MTGRSIRVESVKLIPSSIRVGGFKHALVSTVAACVARRGRLRLENVPSIRETEILSRIMAKLGASVTQCGSTDLQIDCSDISCNEVDGSLSSEIHGSVYLIPALIAASGKVQFKGSGGCRIGDKTGGGERPIHHMVHVLERFGARFRRQGDWLIGEANGLDGCIIDMMDYSDQASLLTGPLVSGATKTAIIAALGAKGVTVVHHPYPKPDVTELLDSIAAAGGLIARRRGAIEIARAPEWPSQKWTEHVLISDLSEIITYIALAVMTGLSITIEGVTADRVRSGLTAEITFLQKMGVALTWNDEALHVTPPAKIRSVDIDVTSVGIYSDHQPFFALMLLKGDRPSRIREHVWRSRFDYAQELMKLGADISIGDGEITIRPSDLRRTSSTLVGRDLRAAGALLVAGVSAGAPFRLEGAEHLTRGYSHLIENLHALGVNAVIESPPLFLTSQRG